MGVAVLLSLLPLFATLACGQPPPNYQAVGMVVVPNSEPRRFRTAFDASALIAQFRDISIRQCAAMCDALPSCRGVFLWMHPEGKMRCKLLRKASQDDMYVTQTSSESLIKWYLKDYVLVAEGNTPTNANNGLRYANALDEGSRDFRTEEVLSLPLCLQQCTDSATCKSVFYYEAQPKKWTCIGLTEASESLTETSLNGFSYAKMRTFAVPSNYALQYEAATSTNPSSSLRFATAFNITHRLSDTEEVSVDACTSVCDRTTGCMGVFWYQLGGKWRCRCVDSVQGDGVPSQLRGYSLRRDFLMCSAFMMPEGGASNIASYSVSLLLISANSTTSAFSGPSFFPPVGENVPTFHVVSTSLGSNIRFSFDTFISGVLMYIKGVPGGSRITTNSNSATIQSGLEEGVVDFNDILVQGDSSSEYDGVVKIRDSIENFFVNIQSSRPFYIAFAIC